MTPQDVMQWSIAAVAVAGAVWVAAKALKDIFPPKVDQLPPEEEEEDAF